MESVIRWTKLDSYNYRLRKSRSKFDGDGMRYVNIYITVDSPSDPEIADISTSINSNGGMIYVEGLYLGLIDMEMLKDRKTLRIRTVEIQKEID